MNRWTPEWHSNNKLDGVRRVLMWDCGEPLMFRTRRECREYIEQRWGYIKTRKDLRAEPHGWRLPKPVKTKIVKVGSNKE